MTMRITIETRIERPINDVFDQLADIDGYARWLPQKGIFISTSQRSEGPVQLGTVYTDRTTVGTFHGEVVEFERPTTIVFCHTLRWFGLPVLETRPGYQLESVAGATKLHHAAEGRLFGVFKLLQARVTRIAREERARTVAALKQSMENTSD